MRTHRTDLTTDDVRAAGPAVVRGGPADVEGPVHVVGADDAAPLALSLAAHRLDQVRSVVLVASHLPLGHPDVVTAVLDVLMTGDGWPAGSPMPETGSLAQDAVGALATRLGELWSDLVSRHRAG